MKITSLTESNTPSSSTSNTTNSAPKFGRSDEFLEEKEETVEESTTAGAVASVTSPVGKVQSRGSMLKGIKTSDKYPNSKVVKESQINEVDPRNFDSDVDYYAARNAPTKPRYRGTSSPGVNQDDEAYFREIFRKKRLAAQQQERSADHDRLATGTNESVGSGMQEWKVMIMNNFYSGKYPDYSARYYSVVAGSPEEARQVVLDNADYVLQDLLSRKLQNGKRVLPRQSALPIEDKRVGGADRIKPGSLTTVGFKQMLTPQGPMLLKFASGKIIAREEPLDVEEGMFGFGSSSKPAQQQKPLDYNAVRQMSQQSGPQRKVYAHPEEYRKVHGEFDEASFDYTMKDMGDDYAGFPSQHSMKHKFLAKIKPEKQQLYKDKMNNTHDWDSLFALFKVAKARGDIIEQGVAESYPKHQDLSGVSTDKLNAYLAKQSQQQVSGEGNQVKRVRAELQRREQGVAEGLPKNDKDEFKRQALLVKDRKTGKLYDPNKEFDKKMKSPEVMAQMKRMAAKEGVAEGSETGPYKVMGGEDGYYIVGPGRKLNSGACYYDSQDAHEACATLNKKYSQQGVAEGDNPEYDDEAGMAESNLHTIARAAQGLIDTIGENENLPEWAQEKIAKVEGMLVAVWDYLESQEAQGIDPQVDEDWQKTNKQDKTDGMSPKAVKAYRRENPGSKLKTAVTTKPSKLKPGSKAAKRRKSFCARMSGNKGPMKDEKGRPTPKAKALRRWNCESVEQTVQMLESVQFDLVEMKQRLDPKCWKGYKKQGTKMKGDTRVNNCVPVSEAEFTEDKIAQDLYKDFQIFKKGSDKDIGSKAKDKEISSKAKDKDIVAKEGAKVDRMVGHVKSSEKKLGHSDKESENIAWATANKRGMLNNKNKK